MSIRQKMESYIRSNYPEAVIEHFLQTVWGTEMIFRVSEESDEVISCVLSNGKFVLLYDF